MNVTLEKGRLPRRLAAVSVLVIVAFCGLVGAAQAAAPAWKLLAVTGPTNLPPRQSEVQQVLVEADAGSLTLAQTTAQGEGVLHFASGSVRLVSGSSQATVLAAGQGAFATGQLITGSGIPAGTTIASTSGSVLTLSASATSSRVSSVTAASREVTGVTTAAGEFHAGDAIAGEGIPAGTSVSSVGSGIITLSGYPTAGGTVALTATETTMPLRYDAAAGEVQEALEALSAFGPGSVLVTGGPGGTAETPYLVDFGGSEGRGKFAEEDVEELVPDADELEPEHHFAHVSTTVPGGPGTGEIVISPANIGGAEVSGEYSVELGPLPAGIVTSASAHGQGWTCPGGADQSVVTCTSESPVEALTLANDISVPVRVEGSAESTSTAAIAMTGAGGTATFELAVTVSRHRAAPGIQAFWAGAYDAKGEAETQAGAHPYSAQAYFLLNTIRTLSGNIAPAGDSREIVVDLPSGFIGDPLVTPRCPQSQLTNPFASSEGSALCNTEMVVGRFSPVLASLYAPEPITTHVWNDKPALGSAAEFTTVIGGPIQSLFGSLRSSEDFGVRIDAPNNPTYNKLYGSYVALEGEPAGAHGQAFLSNPGDCTVQREETERGEGPATHISGSTWQLGTPSERTDPLPLITGCQALTEAWFGRGPEPEGEEPSFTFEPSTTQASSPAGATADLHIPQVGLTDPAKLATASLKNAVVTLPKGLTVNPSSASGLESCTETQVGYLGNGFLSPNPTHFDEAPVSCPEASKLGSFTIKTPLLEEEVEGTIYLAAQEENPFDSLIALYLIVEDKRFGLTLKLPGEVRSDPATGQLTATFDNNPQLPFEDLTLHFRGGGPRSTLATPETCGHFEATGSLEPWSAESGEALPIHEAGFSTSGSCSSTEGARPFAPSFEAGTTGTQAGSYSPLVIKVGRNDGEQELKNLDFTLPEGLLGKLSGIPYCSDAAIKEAEAKTGKAEQASPSCPTASRIGSVDTAAGVGSEPIHVGGSVYLAGPYKGAPLSAVVITPAVAGPFDLGDVVIRAPLFVDPETSKITAKSDPIPTILRGIPLKLRSVEIYLDRSDFTLNPTSCEPMAATASIAGSSGATASPSNHFQVDGCKSLKFRPKLQISLKGATRRTGLPALKAVVTYPKQGAYANIARAQVNLPHSEFLEQNNLSQTCTKPVLLEGRCPARSIYGKAKAWTPLLEKPLEGPVYLVGGYGYKLPALVAELNGQIRVVLKGKVDSGPNNGIRNTFEAVPDAPISRFVLELKGGKKYGLLINSENLCRKPQRAIARFTAQNGRVEQSKPLVANQCGKKKSKRGKAAAKKH